MATLNIEINDVVVGSSTYSQATVLLDTTPIPFPANFPKTMSAEKIRDFVENDLVTLQDWSDCAVIDNRTTPSVTVQKPDGISIAYASEYFVKLKTRQEHGTAAHRGTQNVRITFAKPFTRRPKVVVSRGKAVNISTQGFVHQLDAAENDDIDYVAIPRNEED